VVSDVDESEREDAPSIIPSCSRRRHTHRHVTSQAHTSDTKRQMSRKIGRIGDWNNNSQSGHDRFVSCFCPFKATSNINPRRGSSEPRIASLRDSTQPDPPARQHVSDDEDEEESSRDQGESWFAGGERRLAFTTFPSIVSLIRHFQVGYR